MASPEGAGSFESAFSLATRLLDERNAESPPDYHAPTYLAVFRHPCERAGREVSKSISLREHYEMVDDVHAAIWVEGRCRKCNKVARSRQPRVVVAEHRPPME